MSACKIEGCEKPVKGRGWCAMHYSRWWSKGDPGPPHSLKPAHVTAHGTVNEYANYGCRCELCKEAMAAKNAESLKTGACIDCGATIWRTGAARQRCVPCNALTQAIPIEERHGTETGYSKGCRCVECRGAAAAARRRRRHATDSEESRARERAYRRRRYVESLTPLQRATSRVAAEMR